MRALVLYDSQFGNTEKLALAIAEALGERGHAMALHISGASVDHLRGLDLLVVGSPNKNFKPSKAITDFIDGLPKNSLRGIRVSAFDTRVKRDLGILKLFIHYAAYPVAKALQRKAGSLALPPQGFHVVENKGHLHEGEIERAKVWISSLV